MLSRRKLFTLGGVAGAAVLLPKALESSAVTRETPPGPGHTHHSTSPKTVVSTRAPVAPFSARMPVPQVLRPIAQLPEADVYELAIRQIEAEILPGVRTPVLSYGNQFVGPTIRAKSARRTLITFRNRLEAPSNVHLHGGHVPAVSDGHPMDLIQPGGAKLYNYPNRQQGATLWYHDHSHHTEAEHVFRGLHGAYLLEDDSERHLGLPGGEYDIPILLRDAAFDESGALVFAEPEYRTTLLANGKPSPYFPVAARKYRLRLLNVSTHRDFTLSLGGVEMTQIATDGGLLPAPVPRSTLLLSPGERVEIVVDFSRHPLGTQLVLADTTGPVLRFDVVRRARDNSRVPDRLRELPPLPEATATREVVLGFGFVGDVPMGLINGRPFDPDRIDAKIKLGTTEIWRITNGDVEYQVPHNFHTHLVQFRVLDRDGNPPLPGETGRKDTVHIRPGESVRVQATFGDYTGRFLYHCHLLEHSQMGMMAQMEITR